MKGNNKKPIKNHIYFDGYRELWDEEKIEIKKKLEKFKKSEKHHEEKLEKIKQMEQKIKDIEEYMEAKLEKMKKNIEKQMEEKSEKNKTEPIADFYAILKKAGFALEQQLNQQIQNVLNNEDLVKLANDRSDLIAGKISKLQKYVEMLSTIFLFPTKNDVANVAKLTLQTEEKVDKLEEYIRKLTESLEEKKNKD